MSNDTPIRVKDWHTYINEHPKFTGCIIDEDGDKAWYKNGKFHREDGPAAQFSGQNLKYWYLYGSYYSEEQHRRFVRQMKLKMLDISQSTL
jgi:hypothetical protein